VQCRHFNHTWIFVTLLCLLCGVIVTPDSICIVTKCKGTEWNITELMLESDSESYSLQDKDISPQIDTNIVTQITLLTQAAHTGLTELTVHLMLHAVRGFMGVQRVTTDSSMPYY
jgi:hypothetical protein